MSTRPVPTAYRSAATESTTDTRKERLMSTAVTAVSTEQRVTRKSAWLAGASNIFDKELREWFRTRRFLITVILAILVMIVIPTGVWLVNHDGLTAGRVALTGAEAAEAQGSGPSTLLALSSYLTIVLTMGMLVKEREAGTAQWIFTKPVSRTGYGLAKWAANSLGVVLATVLVPGVTAAALVSAMFDVPGWSWVDQGLAAGVVALHATFVVALMLALGTLFRSTVPVAVTALGLSFAPLFLAPLLSSGMLRMMPVFGLGDLVSDVATGRAGAGDFAPVVAGLIFLPLCLGFAGLRLTREELQ
jgi:ABC-2 type transport system permease protein